MQKHAIFIIFNKNKFRYTREIFKEQKVLNIYQLNILSNIIFMHRKKTLHVPYFTKKFVRIPTPIQQIFWLILAFFNLKLKKSKYRVFIRGLLLWRNRSRKNSTKSSKIPDYYKGKFLSITNEINYF